MDHPSMSPEERAQLVAWRCDKISELVRSEAISGVGCQSNLAKLRRLYEGLGEAIAAL